MKLSFNRLTALAIAPCLLSLAAHAAAQPAAPAVTPPPAAGEVAPVAEAPPVTDAAATQPAAAPEGSQTAAPLANSAEPTASETAAPVAEPAKPALPEKLATADGGSVKLGSLLQFWFLASADHELTTAFRLRRAELKLSGELVPDAVAFKIMIDPAKVLEFQSAPVPVAGQDPAPTAAGSVTVAQPTGAVSMMQDFEITFLSEFADLSLGQFKNPMSLEGYGSASKLIFPERARVSRKYGDIRDIGIRVEKTIDMVHYYVGLFNGPGQNRLETRNQKDLGLRLEVTPIKGVLVGAAGYTSLGERDQATTKDRVEGDVKLELADFLLQAEYLHAWDGASGTRKEGHGVYGVLGYTVLKQWQPVVRIGYLDADLDGVGIEAGHASDYEVASYEVGLNYAPWKPVKLQLAWSFFQNKQVVDHRDLTLAAQAAF